jgi:hypothetical protein
MANLAFNKKFTAPGGSGAVGLELPVTADAEVVAALAGNRPFPNRQLPLGSFQLKAQSGKAIEFGDSARTVAFSGSGSAFAGLGVYQDPQAMLKALPLGDTLEKGVQLPFAADEEYVLLQWGYDARAAAKGALALAAGASVSFGIDGRSEGLFAVIRRFNRQAIGAASALESTVHSWMLPRQVKGAGDLEPGSWIIAEVDGGISLSLGATFGYDFNWAREAQLGGLKEDIGLRLQLGVKAALGFEAGGKYAVVVSRDSLEPADQRLRLRLFKQSKRGVSFAFNAAATAQGRFSNLPDTVDDFIKAVFDVHGGQAIDDLHAFERWLDPARPLPDMLAGLSVDYGRNLLARVTGIDAEREFDRAQRLLTRFLREWDTLPERTSSLLFSLVERKADLGPIRALAKAVAANASVELRALLDRTLNRVAFFETPEGQWLESIAVNGVLTLLDDAHALQAAQTIAQRVVTILDGSTLEAVLKNLQAEIATRLRLEAVLDKAKMANEADFATLDAWLKLKLSQFLGRTIDFAHLDDIRKTVAVLLAKRQQFYEAATKALTEKYAATFAATYQRNTTRAALVDVEFDFTADAAGAGKLLAAALSGDFNTVLTQPSAGAVLRTAELTHGIERSSHVDIHLPRVDKTLDSLTAALAKVSAQDDGGRLLVYDLHASNLETEKGVRNSRLAVAGHLAARKGTGVRVHATEGLTYSYAFRQAVPNMKVVQLRAQAKPYLDTYFGSLFTGEVTSATWLSDLDKQIDTLEPNGTDNFGNTLLALELSLPASVASGWLLAPEDRKSPLYMEMSRRLQAKLKELIPFYYFADVTRFRTLGAAAPLLVYAAIPPSTDVTLSGGQLTINPRDPHDLYWDFVDPAIRNAMVQHPTTAARLAGALRDASERLTAAGFAADAMFYQPDEVDDLRTRATTGAGSELLRSLLFVEAELIRQAQDAGRRIANFRSRAGASPEEAIQALAGFGQKITEAFNKNLTSVYGSGALRPLGTMAFIEAASCFLPNAAAVKPSALFQLTVVKRAASFKLDTFLDGKTPKKEEVVIEERLAVLR